MRNEKVQKLTLTALMAALSYVIFTFLTLITGAFSMAFPSIVFKIFRNIFSVRTHLEFLVRKR